MNRQTEPVRVWQAVAMGVGLALSQAARLWGVEVPIEVAVVLVAAVGLLARRDAWSPANVDRAMTAARAAWDVHQRPKPPTAGAGAAILLALLLPMSAAADGMRHCDQWPEWRFMYGELNRPAEAGERARHWFRSAGCVTTHDGRTWAVACPDTVPCRQTELEPGVDASSQRRDVPPVPAGGMPARAPSARPTRILVPVRVETCATPPALQLSEVVTSVGTPIEAVLIDRRTSAPWRPDGRARWSVAGERRPSLLTTDPTREVYVVTGRAAGTAMIQVDVCGVRLSSDVEWRNPPPAPARPRWRRWAGWGAIVAGAVAGGFYFGGR